MGIFKKIIEVFRKIVIGYVFYTFPLTLIAFVIIPKPPMPAKFEEVMNYIQKAVSSSTLYSIALDQILLWMLISWLFSISMFFSKNNREIFLKKLSGIKERDEREVQIVGKSMRASYLTTMTILLTFLFLSIFYMEVAVNSADTVESGKERGYYSVGIWYNPITPWAISTEKEGYDSFFGYYGLPISPPTLILILLLWQIVSFRIVSRRALKVPE
jgi:hypothetical protein